MIAHHITRALTIATLVGLSPPAHSETFITDVWTDTWLAMSVNGAQVFQDHSLFPTKRAFNAESFRFEAQRPFVIGITATGFQKSGLDIESTSRQNMSGGGVMLQIKDANGTVVTASNANWTCLVTRETPLQNSCGNAPDPSQGACAFDITDTPVGWDTADFDASDWQTASVWNESDVRPKDVDDRIKWDSAAQLISGANLDTNNIVLCRIEVNL